jgi:uncharacterized protein YgiM (DUF1202 family)
VKRPELFELLRLLLPGMPRVQLAGGNEPLHFSSSGGGGGSHDDPPDDDYYDDYEDEPAPRRRSVEEHQPTAARRRTVQAGPDDRYWTDYLRIALPVIGLLLVIAVFWFWAQQLIDSPDDDVTPTEAPGLAEVIESPVDENTEQEVVATPPDEPQPTQPPVVTPTPAEEEVPANGEGEQPADGTDNQAETDADVAPEEAEPAPGGIGPDMEVVVTEDVVNMRSEASTDGEIVTVLDSGAQLTIVSGPQEGGEYTWWEVTDQSGNIGWVVEDFIEPAG